MFCKWVGKTPNELIEMQKKALEHNGDRRENMVLGGDVKRFLNYLEKDAFFSVESVKALFHLFWIVFQVELKIQGELP